MIIVVIHYEAQDSPRAVLAAHGRPDSLAEAGGAHPAGISQAGQGPPPYPLPVILRIHCVQLFYNLSDPSMEDLLYEAESVRTSLRRRRGLTSTCD